MTILSRRSQQVLAHPVDFARRVLGAFSANQGVLLAGAVAYYALLSVVPLLALSVGILSHLVDQAELMETLGRYLEWLVPSQSRAVLTDVSGLLENRLAINAVLLATLLFFSTLAFSVLQKAMGIIFAHRHATHKRHSLVAALLPYLFVLCLGIAMLLVTVVSIALQSMADESIHFWARDWSLQGISGFLLYLLGVAVEGSVFISVFLVMPAGRTRFRHALIGGVSATLIWEIARHLLVWYFTHISKASIVYGSLTTAVVALFSMELAATLLLLGAQVIAEYEQLDA